MAAIHRSALQPGFGNTRYVIAVTDRSYKSLRQKRAYPSISSNSFTTLCTPEMSAASSVMRAASSALASPIR